MVISYNYYNIHWHNNYAANGFCDAETILSESGITFYWPETQRGVTATFTCPLNREIVVARSCGIGGEWSGFDESACDRDGISGQLNDLIDLFSNVRPSQ